MKAAILTKPKFIEITKIDLPEIQNDQVRIRVEGCGICASSIPVWEGRDWFNYPMEPGSPGHEGWGTIDAIGDKVDSFSVGDRVAFLSGHAYAEFDVAYQDTIVKLPKDLPTNIFPGEPLGCAMNIFDRSDISESDTVAVIGIGFLGALICQLAKNKGAKVIAISRRKFSLDIAKKYGADDVIEMSSTWDVANKVVEITNKNLCTRVVEATGKQQAIDIATEIVAERGKLIIAGYHQDGLRQVDFQKWNWKGINVINAHEREASKYLQGMKNAVAAVEQGIINPEPLYTNCFKLDEINEGFEMLVNRPDGFMKAIIEIY